MNEKTQDKIHKGAKGVVQWAKTRGLHLKQHHIFHLIRTAGLPIFRLSKGERAPFYARESKLDQWLESRESAAGR